MSYNIGDVVGNFPGTSGMYLNLTYNANSDDIWATSGLINVALTYIPASTPT